MRVAVAEVLVSRLKSLKLAYPTVDEAHKQQLAEAKKILLAE